MKEIKRLPEAELKVMQIVWSLSPPVTAGEIQQNADKDWKATSVLTFLSRLCKKGFLECKKEGRQNYYTALIGTEEYRRYEGKRFLRSVYGGSVKKLVASLSDAGELSDEDLEELRDFLDQKSKGKG